MSLTVMALLSMAGGYLLSKLILHGMNDLSQQRTEQLFVIHESLDDAAVNLGHQIQEWKDMLMRINDMQIFSKHQKAFIDTSVAVQYALLRTKTATQRIGIDTKEIDQLSLEHKALLANYLRAETILKSQRVTSAHEADRQIIGADRSLQKHMASVRENLELQTRSQLNNSVPAYWAGYLLIFLLGASLWFMGLVGVNLAFFSHPHEARNAIF